MSTIPFANSKPMNLRLCISFVQLGFHLRFCLTRGFAEHHLICDHWYFDTSSFCIWFMRYQITTEVKCKYHHKQNLVLVIEKYTNDQCFIYNITIYVLSSLYDKINLYICQFIIEPFYHQFCWPASRKLQSKQLVQ